MDWSRPLERLVWPDLPTGRNNRDIVWLSAVALVFWLMVLFPGLPGGVFQKGRQVVKSLAPEVWSTSARH
jgi:hypothetical protein